MSTRRYVLSFSHGFLVSHVPMCFFHWITELIHKKISRATSRAERVATKNWSPWKMGSLELGKSRILWGFLCPKVLEIYNFGQRNTLGNGWKWQYPMVRFNYQMVANIVYTDVYSAEFIQVWWTHVTPYAENLTSYYIYVSSVEHHKIPQG